MLVTACANIHLKQFHSRYRYGEMMEKVSSLIYVCGYDCHLAILYYSLQFGLSDLIVKTNSSGVNVAATINS